MYFVRVSVGQSLKFYSCCRRIFTAFRVPNKLAGKAGQERTTERDVLT